MNKRDCEFYVIGALLTGAAVGLFLAFLITLLAESSPTIAPIKKPEPLIEFTSGCLDVDPKTHMASDKVVPCHSKSWCYTANGQGISLANVGEVKTTTNNAPFEGKDGYHYSECVLTPRDVAPPKP